MSLDHRPPTTTSILRVNAFDVPCVQDRNPNFRDRVWLTFNGFNVDTDENDVVAIRISRKTQVAQCVAQHLVPVTLLLRSLVWICRPLWCEAGLNDSHLGPPGELLRCRGSFEGSDVFGVDCRPRPDVKRGRIQRSSQVTRTRGAAFTKLHVELVLVHGTNRDSEESVQFEIDFFEENLELGGWNQEVRVSGWLNRVMKIETCKVSNEKVTTRDALTSPKFGP